MAAANPNTTKLAADLTAALQAVGDALTNVASAAVGFTALVPSFTQLKTVAVGLGNVIGGALTSAVSSAAGAIGDLASGIGAVAVSAAAFVAVIPGVKAAFLGLASVLGTGLTAALSVATKAVAGFLGGVKAIGGGFASGVLEVITEIASGLGTMATAGAAVLSIIPGFSQLQAVLGAVAKGVASLAASLVGLVPGFSQVKAAAVGLISFLGGGLGNALSSAAGTVKAWAGGLVGSVKSFLGTSQTAWAVAGAFDKVGAALGTAGKAAFEFVKAQNQLVSAITGSIASVAKLGAGLLRLPFDVLDSAISAVQMNVARFVKLADPGVYQIFERSVLDLQGTIGRILVPVLKVATQLFTSISQAIAGLNGDGQRAIQMLAAGTVGMVAFAAAATAVTTALSGGLIPIISAVLGGLAGMLVVSGNFKTIFDGFAKVIGGVLNEVGKAVGTLMPLAQPSLEYFAELGSLLAGTLAEYSKVFTSLAPELGVLSASLGKVKDALMVVITAFQGTGVAILSTGIKAMADILATAAPYIAAFTRVVADLIAMVMKGIANLFGITLPALSAPKGALGSSKDAAVRNVTSGSVESALTKARESAFAIGRAGIDPATATAANTAAINAAMNQTALKIDQIIKDIEALPSTIGGYISGAANALIAALSHLNPLTPGPAPGTDPIGEAVKAQIRALRAAGVPI